MHPCKKGLLHTGSVLALSVTCGATSPKGRGLGKSAKFAVLPKAPTLGELAKPQGFD